MFKVFLVVGVFIILTQNLNGSQTKALKSFSKIEDITAVNFAINNQTTGDYKSFLANKMEFFNLSNPTFAKDFDLNGEEIFSLSLINQDKARLIDQFNPKTIAEQTARLDNLSVTANNDPVASIYITYFAGRREQVYVEDQAEWLVSYLKDRGIDPARMTIVNRGEGRKTIIQFWIVPPGAVPPA